MDEKIRQMEQFFAERIAACERQSAVLRRDGREDEAVFERIRQNVYDIFRTVLRVGTKNKEDLHVFYPEKLKSISSNWNAAHKKATAHQDALKIQPEEIKLATVAEIERQFWAIWRDTQ